MNNRRITMVVLGLVAAMGLVSCSDDVASNDGPCAAHEEHNPISGECINRCSEGQSYNPVSGNCVFPGHTDPNNNPNNTSDTGLDTGTNPTDTSTPINDDAGPIGNEDVDPLVPGCGVGQDCDADIGGGGPGTPVDPWQPQDPSDIEYHSCTAAEGDGFERPLFMIHHDGNYLVTAERSATASAVSGPGGGVGAHVFEDPQHHYTGFVVSLAPGAGESTSVAISDNLLTKVRAISGYNGATRSSAGHVTRSHDGFTAVVKASIDLPSGTNAHTARDAILAHLLGIQPAQLQHNLNTAISGGAGPTTFVYEVLRRNGGQYLLVGALATRANYTNDNLQTGIRIDNITGGTSLAFAEETMTDECLSVALRDTTEVDIIISLDRSGSMNDVAQNLTNFAQEFTQLLDAAGADWRVGVTGVDCLDIKDDTGLSQEFRDLWPVSSGSSGGFFNIPGVCEGINVGIPVPGGNDDNNGKLLGTGFTTDYQQIQTNFGNTSTTGLEYTLTMGVAAIDRSLPRADNDPFKIRSNAAVILVVVTDENEELFKQELSFIGGTNQNLSASQRTEMEAYIQPWLNYLNRPDIGAIVYGLYWVPGTTCQGGIDVAHGIHHVVQQTGGEGGSICQPDVTDTFRDIAAATRDLSGGLRLIGVPVAQSIRVNIEDLDTNTLTPLNRSRVDGYDFDPLNNSINFEGPSTPETGERAIVPYLRWNRTVIPCEVDDDCNGLKCYNSVCG